MVCLDKNQKSFIVFEIAGVLYFFVFHTLWRMSNSLQRYLSPNACKLGMFSYN